MIDLLVVGGGPAGLATAIRAAQEGLGAVVVERRPGIIDKACGEGLMPPAVRSLEAMGVALPAGYPFDGIRYVRGPHSAQGRFAWGQGLGIRRRVLHGALLKRAESLGVRRIEARVRPETLVQGADFVEVAGLRARYLAACDGLHSPLRRALNLELPPHHPTRYGIRRHYARAPWCDLVEVHWAADCEAYVTPLGKKLIGVAVLFTGKGSFEHWLGRFPALRDRLGEPCTAPMGAGPFERRVRSRVSGRVLLAGDAAGFLDPITGEGVQLAFAAAEALVHCVARGCPEDYERAWRRLARRYWWMTSLILALARGRRTRRSMVPLLRMTPGLFNLALRLLTRGAPRALPSPLPAP